MEDPIKMGGDLLKLSRQNIKKVVRDPLNLVNPVYGAKQGATAVRTLGGDWLKTLRNLLPF